MDDNEYYNMYQTLNIQQRTFVNSVLMRYRQKHWPIYVFLSGGAGVGKSVCIKILNQALLREMLHSKHTDISKERVVVGCYTGTAAFAVGGRTLHGIFKLHEKHLSAKEITALSNLYGSLECLIIDEISFLSNSLFSQIEERCRNIKQNDMLFGGISVICVGDLFQLQPLGQCIFMDFVNGIDAMKQNIWKDNFSYHCLTQIMRQQDGSMFAQLLNRLREGNQTEKDIQVLKSRVVEDDHHIDAKIPRFFYNNSDVNEYNDYVVETRCEENEAVMVIANDRYNRQLATDVNFIKMTRDDHKKQVMYCLKLVVGMQYMISVNVNTEDGLTNGVEGTLKHIQFDSNYKNPIVLWMEFPKGNLRRDNKI